MRTTPYPNGNLHTIGDLLNPVKSRTYEYDGLDRLVTATSSWPAGQLTYTYDGVGNRLTEGGSLGSSVYQYTANRLTGITGPSTTAVTYNGVGNTITENNRAYLYDLNNRLVQVTENGNTLGMYTYDGQGRRMKKTANGQTTYYLYDLQNRLLGEVDGVSGAPTHLYAYLPDRPIAKIDLDGASPNLVYYHSDPVGTPLFMTNSGGQVVWKADLLPFGEAYQINEDVDGNGVHVVNNLRFPGQYYDAETGLHYNMARDYTPGVGRYIESDPIGIKRGENNLFAYANDNPNKYIDPKGLSWSWPFDGNLLPGHGDQDHICTLKNVFGSAVERQANNNQCVKNCCKNHDDCYTTFNCNWTSWLGPIPVVTEYTGPCIVCNAMALSCIGSAITRRCIPPCAK